LFPVKITAQSISNEGTEFFAVFPLHVASRETSNGPDRLANYSIFITAKENSKVIVSVGSLTRNIDIIANQVVSVPIPRSEAYLSSDGENPNKAIHIQVLPGQPKVVVYGHIFAGARSAASLILPVEALGQQYFSMNYDYVPNTQSNVYNYIVIVATEPNTTVLLKKDGSVIKTINLVNAGDVYQYLTTDDPTGTEIIADPVTSACTRFAVFTGSTNSTISSPGCAGNSSDPLYQQIYPVESWGTTYGFIPFSSQSYGGGQTRTSGSIYRILAKDDNTEVKINGNVVAVLNSGQFYPSSYSASPSNVASVISANKPVSVAQYAISQSCAGGNGFSDPDMVILNPIEYNIKNITVYSSDREDISEKYLNILIKTIAAPTFKINGAVPSVAFSSIPSAPEYSYLKLNLNSYGTGNFTLSADDGFNAVAYGFGDHESYAYSAGTNLASNQTITAIRIATQQELPNACTKEDFEFKLVLPAIASELTWKFDNDAEVVQTVLNANSIERNGKAYYEYFYPGTHLFDEPGAHNIKVTAKYLNSNICYVDEQELNFVFDVYNPPVAGFSVSGSCALEPVLFSDASTSATIKPVIGWNWDFGDGTTSNLQHPTHKYATSGTFTVKLVVDNGTGCLSDVNEQTLLVRPLPLASFSASQVNCTDNSITFTDASVTSDGIITQWFWDFGDGNTSHEQNPTHIFSRVGDYIIKLNVMNSFGCTSNSYNLNVNAFAPSLNAGPDKTILKGGQTTLAIEAEGVNLTYKWTPATGLNRDDIKTPVASPDAETVYTVTVTSDNGCVLTDDILVKVVDDLVIPNTFTPNGDGINDTWVIRYLESFPTVDVKVFNRFGAQVFNSTGYKNPWDGSYNGDFLMPGVYYYIITTPISPKPYSGYITILK